MPIIIGIFCILPLLVGLAAVEKAVGSQGDLGEEEGGLTCICIWARAWWSPSGT